MSGRPRGARVRAVAVVLALGPALGMAACATAHPFERELDAGRYEEAARAFEADSALWSRPEALLLAGRLYGDAMLPTYDVNRARVALSRLVEAFPESEEAERGRPLLTLLAEVARVQEELRERTGELEALSASREAVARDLEATRRRIERLEAELGEARRELERLKAVDLRPRPGAPR